MPILSHEVCMEVPGNETILGSSLHSLVPIDQSLCPFHLTSLVSDFRKFHTACMKLMNILGLRCLFDAYENLRLKLFIEFGICCFRLFSVFAYVAKRVSESHLQCLVLRCLVRDTGRQKML